VVEKSIYEGLERSKRCDSKSTN